MLGTFLAQTKHMILKPHIVCGDGFTFSLQQFQGFHCNDQTVEIGAFNRYDPLLRPYHEGDGIYGYVPFNVVERILTKHKGINYMATFGGKRAIRSIFVSIVIHQYQSMRTVPIVERRRVKF